jgi:hypothetical protein
MTAPAPMNAPLMIGLALMFCVQAAAPPRPFW